MGATYNMSETRGVEELIARRQWVRYVCVKGFDFLGSSMEETCLRRFTSYSFSDLLLPRAEG